MMLNENHFIFRCKMGVTFDKDHEDPYTIWLYDDTTGREWIHGLIRSTLEQTAKALGESLPCIISDKQKPQQLPDNCSPHHEEKV